jgi:predicted RecA/RadA family phage recombinase
MADYAPKYSPGDHVTYAAAAAIVGGNVVYLSAAGQVTPTSAAAATVVGVASTDAATGDYISVVRGGVQRLVSGAAIAVGDPLKSAASGRVVPTSSARTRSRSSSGPP